jgi:cysteinyl-tRNA synthetase
MVTVDGQKMGKSLGNFITLKQLFADIDEPKHDKLSRKYDPLAVRQLILNSHYRSPIDFSDAALTAAQSGYDKIEEAVRNIRREFNSAPEGTIDKKIDEQLSQLKTKFEEAMNDDLNTSVALSVIFDLVRLANQLIDNKNSTKETLNKVDEAFRKLGGDCLGIVKEQYAQAGINNEKLIDCLVKGLIEQRNNARKKKDFAASDAIRDRLSEAGIVLEDGPSGTTWRLK